MTTKSSAKPDGAIPPEPTERSPIERLRAVFGPRRSALRHTIAWVLSDGQAFAMDPRARELLTPGWRPDADATVLTNAATLAKLLDGLLDPAHPRPGDLFVWGGDPEALAALGASVRGLSPVAMRSGRGGGS